jgi:hypothetical protein
MRAGRLAALLVAGLIASSVPPAQALTVHVQRTPRARSDVGLHFAAPALPEGGYYYAVVVLRPYKHYTRDSPPPCSTSSDMQRTDYGWPGAHGRVVLALTPAKSKTRHWCRGGRYEGAVYAVPHPPPCESSYPCYAEPYKGPCAGAAPPCVHGIIARPKEWEWPDPLPRPRASGTSIVGRFTVVFPAR